MQLKIELTDQPARIDPDKIPDVDYELGCRVLAASIKRILADPVKRAQYEEWKAERANRG